MPIIFAHGTLGDWDELIFLGIAAVFIVMMVVSWVMSRSPELADPPESSEESTESSDEHFELE